MKPYSWIKLSTNFFEDPKILRLKSYPESEFLFTFWIKLVLLSIRRADGLLMIDENIPYSLDDFKEMFPRQSDNTIKMALSVFEKLNMIVVQTTEYGETILGVSDFVGFVDVEGLEETRIGNRERQAKFRERQKLALAKASKKDNKTSEITDIEGDKNNALLTDGCGVTNGDLAVSNEKVTRQNRIDKIREEEKEKREENTSAPNDSKNESGSTHDTSREKTPPIDFDFSTGEFSNITEKYLQIWTKAYPAVDILMELRRMARVRIRARFPGDIEDVGGIDVHGEARMDNPVPHSENSDSAAQQFQCHPTRFHPVRGPEKQCPGRPRIRGSDACRGHPQVLCKQPVGHRHTTQPSSGRKNHGRGLCSLGHMRLHNLDLGPVNRKRRENLFPRPPLPVVPV